MTTNTSIIWVELSQQQEGARYDMHLGKPDQTFGQIAELLKGGILGSRIPDILNGKSGHFIWKHINGLIFYQILKKNVLNPSI